VPPTRPHSPRAARRRRAAVAALAAFGTGALVAGLVAGAGHQPAEEVLADRYADAYARGDWAALHGELTAEASGRWPLKAFARAHRTALETATATRVAAAEPRERDGRWVIPVRVETASFGPVRGELVLPVADEDGDPAVAWDRALVFPGLRRGERLRRRTELPERGTLRARDGTVLAGGADRASPIPELAASVAGRMGPVPPERAEELAELGVPEGATVGLSGLERAFDDRLLGTPGGRLLAGDRVLAERAPRAGADVRTTVDLGIQQAAVTALGPRLGGVVALRPSTGAVLAFAGIPFSGLQPPGSTFKVVTATAALEAGLTRPSERFGVQTSATIEGVELQNANGESCGGTLVESFAHSCNSVFAPLGAEVGARRLVAAAERFGFNREPDIPGVATSTIPPAGEIGDDLAVGASAIGQGRLQATTVEMASIAAAVAMRGRMPRLTLDTAVAARPAQMRRVTDPRTARTVRRLMRAVVTEGTGTGAAIEGVRVAGKTGTAELRTTQGCTPQGEDPPACAPTDDPTDTSAWFIAFAPAGGARPRVAVGVLLVGAGAGGESAAPVARSVLLAALERD
jgi:cell division protein FtsI/penicillin-binding protein 2